MHIWLKRLEYQTQEEHGSNPLAAVLMVGQFWSLHIALVHSTVQTIVEFLVIDRVGCKGMRSHHTVSAACLNASQRCRVGVGMNRNEV